MRTYDKNGEGHMLVEADTSFPELVRVRYLRTDDDVNDYTLDDSGSASNYGIGMGVINSEGYVSFYIGWICIQMRVLSGGQGVKTRYKYGNSEWSDWFNL